MSNCSGLCMNLIRPWSLHTTSTSASSKMVSRLTFVHSDQRKIQSILRSSSRVLMRSTAKSKRPASKNSATQIMGIQERCGHVRSDDRSELPIKIGSPLLYNHFKGSASDARRVPRRIQIAPSRPHRSENVLRSQYKSASVAQGCADFSSDLTDRNYSFTPDPQRPSPSLRPGLSFRYTQGYKLRTPKLSDCPIKFCSSP